MTAHCLVRFDAFDRENKIETHVFQLYEVGQNSIKKIVNVFRSLSESKLEGSLDYEAVV